jgi:hypothetical protein
MPLRRRSWGCLQSPPPAGKAAGAIRATPNSQLQRNSPPI